MPKPRAAVGKYRDTPLRAQSISRSAWEKLQKGPHRGHVLAVFERACALQTSGHDLVSLVLPEVGDGPLNIVVNDRPQSFHALQPGMPFQLEGNRLGVEAYQVSFERANIWEPCPPWEQLRVRREAITERLPLLQELAVQCAQADGLLMLAWDGLRQGTERRSSCNLDATGSLTGASDRDWVGATYAAAREGAEALAAGWMDDRAKLQRGAARLAGLGGGLTPAGDDFLAGVMLWAWLAHPIPQDVCRTLLETASPCTSTLSAAFLQAASEGECSAAWHRLLVALEGGTRRQLAATLREVLSQGNTSGADSLAGFLWIEHRQRREQEALAGATGI
jgi:hypothetical protein